MRSRYSSQREDLAPLSALFCVLGLLLFLVVTVTAGSLSRAVGGLRINIEGFSERDREPITLECRKGQAISLNRKYKFALEGEEETLRARKWTGTAYTNFLNALSKDQREYVLFLVRPDGIKTFEVLRDILVLRNDSLCTVSVAVNGKATRAVLPAALREKILFGPERLSFLGRMTSSERDQLAELGAASRADIQSLFQKSQASAICVDHGSELLPAEWKWETDENGQVRFLQDRKKP